jgi:hypothetical protein
LIRRSRKSVLEKTREVVEKQDKNNKQVIAKLEQAAGKE